MSPLDRLRRIAEVEFADSVVQTDMLGAKMRVLLADDSYIDVWVSRKLSGRFGFHWERRHLDGRIYAMTIFLTPIGLRFQRFPFISMTATRTRSSLPPLPWPWSRAFVNLWPLYSER